jgi:N-acetylmuramic acid 6-phosphate etherase
MPAQPAYLYRMDRPTESASPYRHLETWTTGQILEAMNREDQSVALAVQQALPALEALVEALVRRMECGGRLFYIGAGTSGRLGILDASECPPTFGVPETWVSGLIAGGDRAIRKAVEGAEDDPAQAMADLLQAGMTGGDVVVGIAASGTTPYVVHGLRACREQGVITGCITCNPAAPLTLEADFPVVVDTGPEFLTGSTRLKAGTAQKMVLNMLSTATMIRLGRVLDNKMVDMQLTNRKLLDRGVRIIMEHTGLGHEEARQSLEAWGSVRTVLLHHSRQ